MKTSELQGAALDWAVAKAEGKKPSIERNLIWTRGKNTPYALFQPSIDWAQGGPIIEREGIAIDCLRLAGIIDGWVAALPSPTTWEDEEFVEEYCGPTPLIAAMRCYVASKMGEEINIPERVSST